MCACHSQSDRVDTKREKRSHVRARSSASVLLASFCCKDSTLNTKSQCYQEKDQNRCDMKMYNGQEMMLAGIGPNVCALVRPCTHTEKKNHARKNRPKCWCTYPKQAPQVHVQRNNFHARRNRSEYVSSKAVLRPQENKNQEYVAREERDEGCRQSKGVTRRQSFSEFAIQT